MIENIQPRTLVIGSIKPSYTKLLIQHSSAIDEDLVGKAFWTQKQGSGESLPVADTDYTQGYRILHNLVADSAYEVRGAFYDAMVDEELLSAKKNVSISDTYNVNTATPPTITDVTVTPRQVDIGVTDPLITVTTAGDAEFYTVSYSTDQSTWTPIATSSVSQIAFSLPAGSYYFRVQGTITLGNLAPEGSGWYEYPSEVTVEPGSSAPNPPSTLTYSIGRIQNTFERYDIRLSWVWDRGTEGNITEFIVKGYPAPNDTYIPTGDEPEWDNPTILTSAGSANTTVLVDMLKDVRMFYRVEALGYNKTQSPSDVLVLTITDDNIDEEYVKGTGVEITYSHILAYTEDGQGGRDQTFKVNAADGSVQIGKLDPVTGAPIRVDPVSGQVHVQGNVIADEINAASFVMTQLNATDRPSIRTNTKTNYGDGEAGLYMGYNADTISPAFQFDMGNTANYIRWDGQVLDINGHINARTLTFVDGQIPSEIDNSLVPASASNLIEDSNFTGSTSVGAGIIIPRGLTYGGTHLLTTQNLAMREASDDWGLDYGGLTGDISHGTPSNASGWTAVYTKPIAVTAGQKVGMSCYMGIHRCDAYVCVNWYDANGTFLGNSDPVFGNGSFAGGGDLANYSRPVSIGIAPANATTATGVMRKLDTLVGNTSSYLFYVKPMLCYLEDSVVEMPEWSGGDLPSTYPNQDQIQIKSDNYVPGGSGWAIDRAGTAEFGQVTVRGHIQADSGRINARMNLGMEDSTSNWSFIDGGGSDYAAYFGNGACCIKKNGECYAASGVFAGSLNAASGTFNGTVRADSIDSDVVSGVGKSIGPSSMNLGPSSTVDRNMYWGYIEATSSTQTRNLVIPPFFFSSSTMTWGYVQSWVRIINRDNGAENHYFGSIAGSKNSSIVSQPNAVGGLLVPIGTGRYRYDYYLRFVREDATGNCIAKWDVVYHAVQIFRQGASIS